MLTVLIINLLMKFSMGFYSNWCYHLDLYYISNTVAYLNFSSFCHLQALHWWREALRARKPWRSSTNVATKPAKRSVIEKNATNHWTRHRRLENFSLSHELNFWKWLAQDIFILVKVAIREDGIDIQKIKLLGSIGFKTHIY